MKKSITILILSASVYFIPGWNGTIAQIPPKFTGSLEYSPALVQGVPGSWDETAVFIPKVFIHDGTFYMFYIGMKGGGVTSIGLATSTDGYDFTKFPDNPVLTPSSSGFDSYMVSVGVVIEDPSGWTMYYNARELAGFGPGPYIGRATATDLTGPWTKSPDPVLTVGSTDEWDHEFIEPDAVFTVDGGGFIMFYSAGDYSTGEDIQIGLATSPDGLAWTKYDDPSTTDAPYAESDPVLRHGDPGYWDGGQVWLSSVLKNEVGYEMYYTGFNYTNPQTIGYATSPDGINWTKYPDNPIYTRVDDPYALEYGYNLVMGPSVVINGLTAFMYYFYGAPEPGLIGMATGAITGISEWRNPDDEMPVTNYPNPVSRSTTFSYTLQEQGQVTLRIYDFSGRLVAEPLNAHQAKGDQQVIWNAEGMPAGIYFYRLTAGSHSSTGKMVVLK